MVEQIHAVMEQLLDGKALGGVLGSKDQKICEGHLSIVGSEGYSGVDLGSENRAIFGDDCE